MLYFSQARDVRRLRDWAGREPERAADVDLRAQQIASQAIAQAYESMALRQSEAQAAAAIAHEHGFEAEVADAVVPAVGEDQPIVAGVEGASGVDELADGEPAPPGEPEPEPIVEGMEGSLGDHPAEFEAEDAVEQPEPAVAGANGHAAPGDPVIAAPPLTPSGDPAADRPAEIAASAAPAGPTPLAPTPPVAGDVRPSRLAPSTPAATRGGPLPPLPPLDTSEFHAVNRPSLPTVPPDYYQSLENTGAGYYETVDRPADKNGSRAPFVIAGFLVVAFAIVLLATQLTGSETPTDNTTATREARDKRTQPTGKRDPRINRPAVVVSVLNGTEISGLAGVVMDQLTQSDFTQVTTGNRNDNVNHVESVVYYAPGKKPEAKEVAQELGIKIVKEADEETAVAGGSAPVIVVLGTDIEQ